MKRIGIVAKAKVNDYGTELQVFALQYVLDKLGYDTEIIGCPNSANDNDIKKGFLQKRFETLGEWLYRGRSRRKRLAFKLFREKFTKFKSAENSKVPGYGNDLRNFDCLLVCEQSDCNLLKTTSDLSFLVVADSVLLPRKNIWTRIANHSFVPSTPYLLVYEQYNSPSLLAEAEKIAFERFLVLVRIRKSVMECPSLGKNIKDIWSAGPCEFLGLIENASIVITNSYIGTAFSIIMERNFYTILHADDTQLGRHQELLGKYGLKDRLLYEGKHISFSFIQYPSVMMKMEDERNSSLDLLKKAIE